MPLLEFIAGWIAGGTGVIVGHPLDTIKARIQTGNAYKGIFDAFNVIIKKESVLGLYKGMFAPFITIGFTNSILFAGYGMTLRILHPDQLNVENRKDLPMKEILFASIVGTTIQLIPVIPVELIKTRLQVQQEGIGHIFHKKSIDVIKSSKGKPIYNGPLDLAIQVVRKEGVRGLYKGGGVMCIRDSIGYLFYLPLYEFINRRMHDKGYGETICQIMGGGSAGCAGWLSICPIEVVKNRVQVIPDLKVGNAIKEVWKEGGIRSFFKGGLILCLRGFPVNAVIFVVYENTIKLLNRSF